MEIFLRLVSVINMNFDTLACVKYSRQSQLCDAAVSINRAQQHLFGGQINLFGGQNSQVSHIRNVFL